MIYINLLEAVGSTFYNKNSVPDALVYGVVRCADPEGGRMGNTSLRYSSGVIPAILDVALISHTSDKQYSLGSMGIVLPDESFIGLPVVVSNNRSRGATIRKYYNKDVGTSGGMHAFNMRKDTEGWTNIPNHLEVLTPAQIASHGLEGILIHTNLGWLVDYSKMVGGTAVPPYSSFSSDEGKKPLIINPAYSALKPSVRDEQASFTPLGTSDLTEASAAREEAQQTGDPLTPRSYAAQESLPKSVEPVGLVQRPEVEPKPFVHGAMVGELELLAERRGIFRDDLIARAEAMDILQEMPLSRIFLTSYVHNLGRRVMSLEKADDFVLEVLEDIRDDRRSAKDEDKDKVDVGDTLNELIIRPGAWKDLGLNPGQQELFVLQNLLSISITKELRGVRKKVVHRSESGDITGTEYKALSFEQMVTFLYHDAYSFSLLLGLPLASADRLYVTTHGLAGVPEADRETLIRHRELLKLVTVLDTNEADLTLLPRGEVVASQRSHTHLKDGVPWRTRKTNNRVRIFGLDKDTRAVLALDKTRFSMPTITAAEDKGLILNIMNDEQVPHLALSVQAEKELKVYDYLHSLGSQSTGVTEGVVAASIIEFERMRGFSLEQLQKNGVGLVTKKGAVLSGCAGSGKTTVSECMTMALEKGLPGYTIHYAAPTGKAARRLAEVVRRPVRTLHSLLGIGVGDSSGYLELPHSHVAAEPMSVFIFDEMAMANINLLYEVISRLDDTAIVYFLGDVKQLKPIGKGIPFRDLMNFMPTVELGVSKRAAEGSGINYNCDLINSQSRPGAVTPLRATNDFDLIPASDAQIVSTIKSAVTAEIAAFGADAVQVVTPFATPKREWSSFNLNRELHDVFNSKEALLTVRGYDTFTTFRVDDRVIHVTSNRWGFKRYIRVDENTFEEVPSLGVANGEVGFIRGYIPSVSATLIPLEIERESGVTPREDEESIREGLYFILVEYYDVDLETEVFIFYHAEEKDISVSEFSGKEFRYGDLENLELAYALTTHKMQGSQSPVVVFPLGSRDGTDFVNRNMVYTALSRASKKVVIVGSVSGSNCNLNNSRLRFSNEKLSVLNLLSKGVIE